MKRIILVHLMVAFSFITNAQERSYSERLKEAKKPFNYLRVDKMKVAKGMGSDYLEIERTLDCNEVELISKLKNVTIINQGV